MSDTDLKMPGGCLDCDAYLTMQEPSPGVVILNVHHDETCPTLAVVEGRRTR